MAKVKGEANHPEGKFDQMLSVLQNIYILQCLQAGMNVDDIRKMMRIDKWRISNISKLLKSRAAKPGKQKTS
jgi:hypothetical protein